jgi:hypothetical protein
MTSTLAKFDKKHLPFGNVFAIQDSEVISSINSVTKSYSSNNTLNHFSFLENYKNWITNNKNNSIKGLDLFAYSCFSNGTTESFDKFYSKHSLKRLRFFKGEYTYHRLACRNFNISWSYLEDDEVKPNDAVIISLPFSNTGNKHHDMDKILKMCDQLNVPVLIDCAYFGICSDLEFDLSFDCITDVTFSLSKTFPVAHHRIGMRLTKVDDDDPLFVLNKIGYVNQYSAYLGNSLIKEFHSDYIYEKYNADQEFYCNLLQIEKSKSVLFGLSSDTKWSQYNRGPIINRLSFHNFFHSDRNSFLNTINNYD